MKGSRDRLRKDSRGESVFGPFVLILVFVVVVGYILIGVARMATSAQLNEQLPQLNNPFFDSNWTVIDPQEGYEAHWGDFVVEICKPLDNDPFIFNDPDDNDDKYVHVVRMNENYVEGSTDVWTMYENFIAVRRNTVSPGSVRGDWMNAAIPLSAFADPANWNNVTNTTVVEFKLGKSTDAIFLCTTNSTGSDIETGIWTNEFQIYYGWSNWRVEDVELSEAIAMAMYADIPGVHWMINYLVHGIVGATMIFVAFTMITRIIPFLGD